MMYLKGKKCQNIQRKVLSVAFLAVLALFNNKLSFAEQTIFSGKNFSIQTGLDIGLDAFYLPHTNFGAGSYSPLKSGGYKKNANSVYSEYYGKPMLSLQWVTPYGFKVFGLISAVGSGTLGDGDAGIQSQTSGYPHQITLEDANAGVEIPLHLSNLHQKIVIEGGQQRFQVDDGFLIGKGAYSTGKRGAWWYAPRYDFFGPGTIKYEGESLRGDIFMLENNSDNDADRGYDRPKTKFVGFDVTWFRKKPGRPSGEAYENRETYVTLTYFHIRSADTSASYDYASRGNRGGLNVAALSWGGTPFSHAHFKPVRNLSLFGNFVEEVSGHAGNGYQSVEAYGLYTEAGYTFSGMPWKPHIFYRYTRLSGSKNPQGTVKRSYDTLFLYSGRRYAYGGYWPGEIVGMYLAPLSDLEIQQFDVTAIPTVHLFAATDELRLGLHYYDLSLIYPTGVGLKASTGRRISDEVDLTAEYSLSPTFSIAFVGGIAVAGPAGRALAKAGVPTGEPLPKIGNVSGIMETYLYKHF